MADDARRPAGGWCSTSCCGCSSRSCGASAHLERDDPGHRATRPTATLVDALPRRACRSRSPAPSRRPIAEIDRRPGRPAPDAPAAAGRRRCRARPWWPCRALLVAVQGGHQGALMAPTEVLAEQHALGVRALLDGRRRCPTTATLAVRRPAAAGRAAHQPHDRGRAPAHPRRPGRRRGRPRSSAPTRSSRRASTFRSLGVVVIDEQHRFGVEQRAALRDKAGGGPVPDVLVMTATPIPRTAAMTVYGDLDVSVLDELPPGRTPIDDRRGPATEDDEAGGVGRGARRGGRRAAGLRGVPADRGVREARGRARPRRPTTELAAGELAGLRLGLLHGRMASAEKEATMDRVPRGRARRARRHHRHRGRRRRPQRHRHGHPRRRPLRHRPAPPAARPGRARGGDASCCYLVGDGRRRPTARRGSRRWCAPPTGSSWPRSTSTCGARARSWASARRAATTSSWRRCAATASGSSGPARSASRSSTATPASTPTPTSPTRSRSSSTRTTGVPAQGLSSLPSPAFKRTRGTFSGARPSRKGVMTETSAGPEPDGFTLVYRSERNRLRRVAHLMTGRAAVAEELVHDAFVLLHQRWDTVEVPAAYLRTTLVRLCLAWRGRTDMGRAREPRTADRVDPPEIDETWELLATLPARPTGRAGAPVLRGPARRPDRAGDGLPAGDRSHPDPPRPGQAARGDDAVSDPTTPLLDPVEDRLRRTFAVRAEDMAPGDADEASAGLVVPAPVPAPGRSAAEPAPAAGGRRRAAGDARRRRGRDRFR